MTTIEQIRFQVERDVGANLDNDWTINKCNESQADFGLSINIPDTDSIAITTDEIEYTLPVDLKIISRLWLQSDRDNNKDTEFKWSYRIYNGKIIFAQPYINNDTLNVDYYRNMTVYTDIADEVDLEDRFVPLYTSYIKMEYYDLPTVKQALGESQARQEWTKHNGRYLTMKSQVVATYSLQTEPTVIEERW